MYGDDAKAMADYTEAIRIDPNYAEAYHARGWAYCVHGNHVNAIADFTEAIRIDPHYAFAYYDRGMTYQEQNDTAKADADFAKAKELGFNSGRNGLDANDH